MRQEQCRCKCFIEGVVGREFYIGHASGDIVDARQGVLAKQGIVGAQNGRVAQELETFPGHVRQQPYLDRFFDIDIFAERAADQAPFGLNPAVRRRCRPVR